MWIEASVLFTLRVRKRHAERDEYNTKVPHSRAFGLVFAAKKLDGIASLGCVQYRVKHDALPSPGLSRWFNGFCTTLNVSAPDSCGWNYLRESASDEHCQLHKADLGLVIDVEFLFEALCLLIVNEDEESAAGKSV